MLDDEGGGLSDERWQVAGRAAQVYEHQLVPAIFGPWAPQVAALAAPIMRAPFGMAEEGALRGLVEGAGFRDVRVDRQAGTVRFGSAEDLVTAYGAGSPLAGPIGAAGPAARAGLLAEVQAALDPWQGPAGLAFPIEALLVGSHHGG
jgi:hypothetical protein